MHPLPCHITRLLTCPPESRAYGPGPAESERRLRLYFGFEGALMDEAWRSLLRLDAAMGSAPCPDPFLGSALSHPHGARALDLALEAFSEIGFLLADSGSREALFGSLERRRQQAACDAISLGLSAAQESSLARHAFSRRAFEALSLCSALTEKGRLDPLGALCGAFGSRLPKLGCNAILADLAVGSFGAWLYRESADASKPKDSRLHFGARGSPLGEPPLGSWAGSLLDALREAWDFDSPLADSSHAARLRALCGFASACASASGRDDPSGPAWLSYFEAIDIAAAAGPANAPSERQGSRL